MPAGRVLATQQARDAAKQLLALTGPVKEQVGRVLQQGGILADPTRWNGSLAGMWRYDWGQDANQLRQAAAKLDELEHRAQQVVEDIFKADGAPGSASIGAVLATDINLRLLGLFGHSQQVHDRWLSLTPEEREALINADPNEIGNLDGIPCVDRDKANRIVLQHQHDELQKQLVDLDEHEPSRILAFPPLFPNPDHARWQAQHDAVVDKLRGLDVINDRLHADDHPIDNPFAADKPPAFLLGLDTDGNGRAIIAINNPDTANNVITYVPGTYARLGQGTEPTDGIASDIDRSDQMVMSADRASGGMQTTSSITWVGYDAPQNLSDATSGDYAENAETSLHNFEVGLRTTHAGEPSHNTIIGHSYGSTAVGFTMRDEGLPVDDVIFVGSPGVGVDDASRLSIDPSHVYAGDAAYDPIPPLSDKFNEVAVGETILDPTFPVLPALTTGVQGIYEPVQGGDLIFGRDPTTPQFGASHLPTDTGSSPLSAHSQYWDDGSASLTAIGRIAVGQQP